VPLRTAAANIRRAGVAVILSDEAPGATPPTRHPEERSGEHPAIVVAVILRA